MDFSQKLSAMQKVYSASKTEADVMAGTVKIPAGDYTAVLSSLKLTESQKKKLMIRRNHVIAEGQLKGIPVQDIMMMESESNFAFFRIWVNTLGFDCPESIEELPALLDAILKTAPKVVLKVGYNGDFLYADVKEVVSYENLKGKTDKVVESPEKPIAKPITKPAAKPVAKPVAKTEAKPVEKPVQAPAPKEESNSGKIEDDLTILPRNALKNLIIQEEHDIRVTTKWSDDDIRNAIRESRKEASGEQTEAKEVQKPVTASVKPTNASNDVDALKSFMKSQGVELTDDEFTIEDLYEIIKAYEFPAKEMTADEQELLRRHNLGELIIS